MGAVIRGHKLQASMHTHRLVRTRSLISLLAAVVVGLAAFFVLAPFANATVATSNTIYVDAAADTVGADGSSAHPFAAIPAAITAAAPGDTVSVKNGTYTLTSTLNISKAITLSGESESGVVIDASGVAGYGIAPSAASGVVLENFTLAGPAANASGRYGVKAYDLTNFTIRNVTVRGSGRSEIDLNRVTGTSLLENVTANGQGTAGVGIALSNSSGVTLRNISTSGNTWGSVGLYDTSSGPTSNIVFEGTYSYDESVYTIYIDTEYHKGVTNLTLPHGFDWAVTNDKFRTRGGDFVLFQQSLSAALDTARAIQNAPYTPNAASTIQAVAADGSLANTFLVGSGMNLSAANNRVAAGGTINVAPGQYDLVKDDVTLVSGQAGWYLPITKNGVTIQGVRADGTPISNPNDVEASIYSTQFTGNGNWSTQNLITVFADDVTIRGVWVMTKVEPNKGIEVLGNNFTADAVKFSPIPASIYPGITNIGGYDYSAYGSGPYFNNNGATTARTGTVTNSLFVRSGISFDSFRDNWTMNISGNTFDGNRVITAGATNYYYSAIGATTWAGQPNFSGSSIAIHDNTFTNLAADQVILKLKAGMTGTFNAERNYWGRQNGPTATNLVSDLPSYIIAKPWYIDAGKTTLSNLADITAFSITGPIAVNGTISGTAIEVIVPNGTDVTALTPNVTTSSSNASPVSPASGVPQDFSAPVTYTVTAVDGTTKAYTVTVKQAQTITVDSPHVPGNSVYGSSFPVAAHSDSGLGVVITASGGCAGGGTGTANISVTSGSTACVVKFNQAGNASFAAATEVTETSLTQKATLTVMGITADDRLYNGGTNATIDTTGAVLHGAVNGDVITLDESHAVGAFADKNAGDDKTVTITGLTTNANPADYTLTQPSTTASVIARPLKITAQTDTKTYDGTVASAVTPIVTTGTVQGGDTAAFTQAFDTKHFGLSKTLTPSGIVNDGNGGNNYTYTFITKGTGEIAKKAITVQAAMDTKVYDGTDASAVAPDMDPLATGDTPAFTQKFNSAAVGNSKTLTPSGVVNDGNSGQNYIVTFTPGPVGAITAAPLTVKADDATKIYGDTQSYSGTEFTTSGLKGSDTVTTAILSSAGAAEGAAVGNYDIDVTGAGGTGLSNYDITYTKGTLTVSKKQLAVTALDRSKVAGTADPALGYSHGALAAADDNTVFSGSLKRDPGENVGTYSITNDTLTAGPNYAMVFTQGTFSILADTTADEMTLATTTSGTEVTGTIPADTTVTGGGTSITIPAGTTVTGTTTWNGVVTYPETTTSYTGPSNPSGYTTSVTLAIEVGDDAPLSFSKGVRLVFAGKAGQRVGWSRDGVFTEITATCSADSQTAGDALAAGGDCKVNSGSDLVVWTKHFTTYLTFTQTQNPSTGGGNGPVAGGGGGGGAAPVALPNNGGAAPSGSGSTGGQVLGVEVYNFTTDLRVGSRGADVTELQKVLIAEGFLAADSATGYFGALTKAAVIKYQAAHGISPQSGIVGPLTRAALNGGTGTTGDAQRATLIQSLLEQVKVLQAKLDALRN